MKVATIVCVFQFVFMDGSAQFAGNSFGRPHPLYMQRDVASSNMITTLALLGFDINEIIALQAMSNGVVNPMVLAGLGLDNIAPGTVGRGPRTQQYMRDATALSLLGLIDGPDVPDGPATSGRATQAGSGGADNGGLAASGEGAQEAAQNQISSGPNVRRQRPRSRSMPEIEGGGQV